MKNFSHSNESDFVISFLLLSEIFYFGGYKEPRGDFRENMETKREKIILNWCGNV